MAFVTPVVEHWLEREIAQWVHHMKDRSDDPSHNERTLLPRSYISLPKHIEHINSSCAYLNKIIPKIWFKKHSILKPFGWVFVGIGGFTLQRQSVTLLDGFRLQLPDEFHISCMGK